jgi:hypothetical protein
MSGYEKRISARIRHTNISEGYCLICGQFSKLSFDHVPPKGSITITKTEQRHIGELMGESAHKIVGVKGNRGSGFKTICSLCNSKLGEDDSEVARVCRELTVRINKHFSEPFAPYNTVSIEFNAIRYMRSMIGHILSATSVEECIEPPVCVPYFSPLIEFVMGNDAAIDLTHEVYYWFYPYRRHLSGKLVNFYDNGYMCCMSVLSFFPIAFLVVEKGRYIAPAQSRIMKQADTKLFLDLSMANYEMIEFPFVELRGNQIRICRDSMCITSYPIGR